MAADYNAAFVYNLDVHPHYWGTLCARKLITAMLKRAKSDRCQYAVVDGRPSSYCGTDWEKVAQNPTVRAAIDRYLSGGDFPTDSELTRDPTLGFYRLVCMSNKVPERRFLWIIPNFLPEDKATNGLRVIGCVELRKA